MKIKLNSAEETMHQGEKLAQYLQPGDLILLDGDLGAGKTTFTKGLARGLDIPDTIKSPTFTIIREYMTGRLPLYHMDVYRLENGGGADMGLEEYFDGDGVSIVEWAQFIVDELPSQFLTIRFERTDDDMQRTIEIKPVGKHYEQLVARWQNE